MIGGESRRRRLTAAGWKPGSGELVSQPSDEVKGGKGNISGPGVGTRVEL